MHFLLSITDFGPTNKAIKSSKRYVFCLSLHIVISFLKRREIGETVAKPGILAYNLSHGEVVDHDLYASIKLDVPQVARPILIYAVKRFHLPQRSFNEHTDCPILNCRIKSNDKILANVSSLYSNDVYGCCRLSHFRSPNYTRRSTDRY